MMTNKIELPVIFIRELVIFPEMSMTLTIGREMSRLAVLTAQERFKSSIVALTQLRAEDEEIKDLNGAYRLGTICKIEKVVALTDGGMQVQVEALGRFSADSLEWQSGMPFVHGKVVSDTESSRDDDARELYQKLSIYQPLNFDKAGCVSGNSIEELQRINKRIAARQKILEEPSAKERVRLLKAVE